MDPTQKVRLGFALSALALSALSGILALHGLSMGPLDEIGGSLPV